MQHQQIQQENDRLFNEQAQRDHQQHVRLHLDNTVYDMNEQMSRSLSEIQESLMPSRHQLGVGSAVIATGVAAISGGLSADYSDSGSVMGAAAGVALAAALGYAAGRVLPPAAILPAAIAVGVASPIIGSRLSSSSSEELDELGF